MELLFLCQQKLHSNQSDGTPCIAEGMDDGKLIASPPDRMCLKRGQGRLRILSDFNCNLQFCGFVVLCKCREGGNGFCSLKHDFRERRFCCWIQS